MASPLFESKFYKVIKTENKSITILSASEKGIDFVPGNDLAKINGFADSVNIFAEKLTFYGSNDPKIGTLTVDDSSVVNLSANRILNAGDNVPQIFARGSKGTVNDGGQDSGKEATNGTGGHLVNIFISHMPTSDLSLIVDVSGGDGATTSNLKTPAGSGGSGGKIAFYASTIWTAFNVAMARCYRKFSLPEDWEKSMEAGAQPLPRTAPVLLEFAAVIQLIKSTVPASDPLLPPILAAAEKLYGLSVITIYDVARAANKTAFLIESACEKQREYLLGHSICKGGLAGQATLTGTGRGINGSDGLPGSAEVTISADSKDMPVFPFLHPTQCQMVLDKADAFFYFGDRASCGRARQLTLELATRIAILLNQPPERTKQIFEAIDGQRKALGIDSALDLQKVFQTIRADAARMCFQLTCTSVDYYGLRSSWVPRTTATEFKHETEAALKTLDKVEKSYLQYTEALTKAIQDQEHRKTAIASVESVQDELLKDIEDMRTTRLNLRESIMDLGLKESIKSKAKELEFQFEQLKTEVTVDFSISPESIKKALTSLAKEPSKEAVISHGKDLVWEGFLSVPNAEGEPIEKSLLLKKLSSVNGDLKDKLNDIAKFPAANPDGELNFDEKAEGILIASAEQIEEFCKDFAKEVFSPRADKIRSILRDYVTLVTTRNQNVVQYNIALKNILESLNSHRNLTEECTKIQNQAFEQKNLEQLQQMTEMIDNMYKYSRARTMKLLSFYRRAIYFSTLSNPDLLSVGGLKNDAALTLGLAKLSSIQEKLSSQLFQLREGKGSDAPRFPANYDADEGKYIQLTEPQLKELKSNRQIFINFPAESRKTTTFPDFRSCADVRAYRVRFWLDNLTLRDGSSGGDDAIMVKIGLTHGGDSVFFDTSNQKHIFTHDPISISWSYRVDPSQLAKSPLGSGPMDKLKPKPKFQAVDSGDIVNYTSNNVDNTAYVAPSPFATWRVSLNDLDERLDVATVTRARFEIFGTSRAFKAATS